MTNLMMKNKLCLTGCLLTFTASALFASPLSLAGKAALKPVIEAAAKRSGRVLTPSLRITAEKALIKAAGKYGDDAAAAVVRKGGLEVLEAGSRHGEPFWKICMKSTPEEIRILAVHADDFMPVIRRVGTDFLKLETRAPGLGKQVIAVFGENSVTAFSRIPAKDTTRLLGLAKKAKSPAVAQTLLNGYEQTGGKILDHLNWKHIIAGGLTTSMIATAYNVSGGVKDGLKIVAEKNPGSFTTIISDMTKPFRYFLYAFGACLLFPVILLCLKISKWIRAIPEKKKKNTVCSGKIPDSDLNYE